MREDYLNSDNNSSSKDKEFENILRPKSFKDFYGQEQIIKKSVKVVIFLTSIILISEAFLSNIS